MFTAMVPWAWNQQALESGALKERDLNRAAEVFGRDANYDFFATWQAASNTPAPATVPETVSGAGVKKEPHQPPPVPQAEMFKVPPPPTMSPAQEAAMLLSKSFSTPQVPQGGVLPKPFPGDFGETVYTKRSEKPSDRQSNLFQLDHLHPHRDSKLPGHRIP